ncbi:MAG: hypothetical protein CMP68_01325 [Flavobacteriales bacterium]|nr:hypothetical protein [Flavobacteriales bacterium]
MKKILLLLNFLLIFSLSNSQVNTKNIQSVSYISNYTINDINNSQYVGGDENVIWEEDFANQMPENISIESVGTYGDWIWSNESTQGQWGANAGLIESPSADNGFMLLDADFFNSYPQNGVAEGEVGENGINSSFILGPIDLSSSETSSLVLQFYTYYRICCQNPGAGNDLNVYISTDEGVTWSDLNYIEGDIYEVNVGTQKLSQIPLSGFNPNVESVHFKFEWLGTHYFWMIDDMSVIQQPAFDLKMLSSWLTMENPAGIEYYSIPESQMPNEMLFGGEIYNYGYNDEVNVKLDGMINNTNLTEDITYELIESDSTKFVETGLFDISSLTAGTYTFTNTVQSNGDDALINDNSMTREFVISENEYQVDGLYETFDYMGTGWPGGEAQSDGMRFANYFDIKESTTLTSARIGLYTNAFSTSLGDFQTTSGGEVIFYLCDTTGLLDPTVTSLDMDFGGIIWESDFIMVEDYMVSDGFVSIDIPDIPLDPNAYLLVVELYSNGLDNDIIILDDTSVIQPWYASMYWSTEDMTWYSNGNAMAIHMGINGHSYVDVEEIGVLNNYDVYPNPTSSFINISNDELLNKETIISIYNILGENIMNLNMDKFESLKTINIENLPNGNYIIKINDGENNIYEKIVKE